MLTSVEMKLLRLALDKGAYDGEAENAAVMLIRKLRSRNAAADDLFSESGERPLTKYGDTVMTFGKYRDRKIKDIPTHYLIWVVNNLNNIDSRLRHAINQFLCEK